MSHGSKRLLELLEEALGLPEDQRPALIRRIEEEDAERGRALRQLLEQEVENDFLEPPHTAPDAVRPGLETGARLGPYRIAECIGAGGMGRVYRAERADQEFEKQVALKVVREDACGGDVLQRFRRERQVLASLEHPNIARLLDGGTTPGGEPFLVMEFVDGTRIDEYCNQQSLDREARLRLFLQACDAVQSAHQALVVHRDLKPSNILVDQDGTVKLLDFGIAKLLDPEAGEADQTLVPRMTPRYASPEQIREQPVTTASDIYSLGVVLYELLAGRPPHDFPSSSRHDMERIICEQAPRPSGLGRDLDAVLLQTIDPQPERRYASVQHLRDDLVRLLDHHPVHARRASLWERTGMLVRRNPVAVAAGSLALVSLIAGLVVSLLFFFEAREAQTLERRRFDDVRTLARTMMFDVFDEVRRLPGSTPASHTMVDTSVAYLERLAEDAGDDPSLWQEVLAGFVRMGDVQGSEARASLRDAEAGLQSFRRAQQILTDQGDLLGDGPDIQELELRMLRGLGDCLMGTGHVSEAEAVYQEFRQKTNALAAEHPGTRSLQVQRATALAKWSQLLQTTGDFGQALAVQAETVALLTELNDADPGDEHAMGDLHVALNHLGRLELEAGRNEDAEQHFLQAATLSEDLVARYPMDMQYARHRALSREVLGDSRLAQGHLDEAEEHYRALERQMTDLVARDPGNVLNVRGLSVAKEKCGDVFLALQRAQESRQAYQEALELQEGRLGPEPSHADRLDHLTLRRKVASSEAACGEGEVAARQLEELFAEAQDLQAQDPDHLTVARLAVECARDGAMTLWSLERPPEAIALMEQGLAHAQKALDRRETPHPALLREVGIAHYFLASWAESLAADTTRPVDERRDLLQSALARFHAGLQNGEAMQERDWLLASEADLPDLFRQDIQRVEAALAELDGGS